ncbi:MAG: PQQ-binding-like beta-propeller repeat protein [Planctomycetota bacterium]|nr:PQQ-binding-like beta-propeller repeat protein [Planctomycetota bacterium]MDA1179448.1 PQQ-binding-like beta-propeller repeat protein [Planctomycetota bacterium]
MHFPPYFARTLGCFLAIVPISTGLLNAMDWLEYRGPHGNGHSEATDLPVRWSEQENVVWKVPIHGLGWSTPVVLDGQIWLTTATEDGHTMSVLCLNRSTGEILFDDKLLEVSDPQPLGNKLNSYASPSPVAEAGRVYVHFGTYGTACYDVKTREVRWLRRDLPCNHFRGPASSPVIFENLLIFHMDGSDYDYIVALNKENGETVWSTNRSTDYGDLGPDNKPAADGDYRKAFNTPILITVGDSVQLISPSAKAVYGYDPRTGREIWQVRHDGHSTACRTLFDGKHVLVNTGSGTTELLAIDPNGSGDITDTHIRWRERRQIPKRSSPLLIADRIYSVTDQGIAACHRVENGELVWQHRVGDEFSASLLFACGRIYCFDQSGDGIVLDPSDEYRELARNRLDNGCMASPVAVNHELYLRTKSHLYCLRAAN